MSQQQPPTNNSDVLKITVLVLVGLFLAGTWRTTTPAQIEAVADGLTKFAIGLLALIGFVVLMFLVFLAGQWKANSDNYRAGRVSVRTVDGSARTLPAPSERTTWFAVSAHPGARRIRMNRDVMNDHIVTAQRAIERGVRPSRNAIMAECAITSSNEADAVLAELERLGVISAPSGKGGRRETSPAHADADEREYTPNHGQAGRQAG